jgi:hypothetical protein
MTMIGLAIGMMNRENGENRIPDEIDQGTIGRQASPMIDHFPDQHSERISRRHLPHRPFFAKLDIPL